MKLTASHSYSIHFRKVVLAFFAGLCLLVTGCGPSQQELMMQSAMRSRSGGDDPRPKKRAVKPDELVAEVASRESESEPEPQPVEIISGVVIEEKDLVAIDARKPGHELSRDDRRKRAFENLKQVSEALIAYKRDKGRYPRTFQQANGFKTLSWRVEILPYLGYRDLYDKFDPSVPHNKPPNQELLKYIPDEFVSPERFDTKTNIVMPSRRGFIGGDGGQMRDEDLDDGPANTLLILEASEELATDWSAPNDFSPGNPEAAREAMLGLRGDGVFGVWANGWPVLLANELPAKIFWDAMTVDAGDGLLAGRIHRDIPLANVSDAAVAATAEPTQKLPTTTDKSTPSLAQPPTSVTRERVPLDGELIAAQAKLRDLFSQRIEDADGDQEKLKLAEEMLESANEMKADSIGAYALQTAAMRLAIDAGGVSVLTAAIDQRIGRYEVDAYEENMSWLLKFGRGVSQRDVKTIDGTAFLKRAVKVSYAAIYDDDYVNASTLARYAYRLIDQKRDEDIPKNLNRLKSLLGAAKREYDNAAESLSLLRIDPDNGDAAAEVGRFLCFIKGDWETGLPLLTKGGSDVMKQMAARDLKGAKDYLNQVAIGDDWWNLSEKARSGVYRQSARDRAVFWYQKAFATIPESLDRLHVKSRLDEAEGAMSSSPLALVNALAKDVSVDLTIGLAAVADVGQADNLSSSSGGTLSPYRRRTRDISDSDG